MPLPRGEVVSDEDFCGLAVVSLDVWARMLAEGQRRAPSGPGIFVSSARSY